MITAATTALTGYLCVVVILAVAGALGARVDRVARLGMKAGQVLVGIYVLVDVISVLQGREPEDKLIHLGYCAAALGVPVLLLNRPGAEDDEPPPPLALVAVAAAATAAMVVRLGMTWT